MKTSLKILILVLFSLIYLSCENENNKRSSEKEELNQELKFSPKFKVENCYDNDFNLSFDILEDLQIRYYDFENKLLFFNSKKTSDSIFYANTTIDTSFFANITSTEFPDKVYIGTFFPTKHKKVGLTFISIYSFSKDEEKYENSFNSFYLLDNSTFINCEVIGQMINGKDCIIASYYEGSGNFLEFDIIGKLTNKIQEITPDLTPIDDGEIWIDSGKVFLLESLTAKLINWNEKNKKLEIMQLDSIPIFNYRTGDKIINFDYSNNEIKSKYKIVVLDWTSIIHLNSKNIPFDFYSRIQYDSEFFEKKFNQLIPKRKGVTTLLLLDDSFGILYEKIKIIIN